MRGNFHLVTALALSLVLMNVGYFGTHSQTSIGSVLDNDTNSNPPEKLLQQFSSINGTSNVATDIFNTHELTLGNNIKNLVILIPNEGHHGPQEDEDRFLDQPFIPQNSVVNQGTNIIWFNGDVGHDHNLVVTSNSTGETVHESGAFPEFEVRDIILNGSGSYDYADTEDYEEGFVMTGNIQVVDNALASQSSGQTGNALGSVDTVGMLMVPTQDIPTYTTALESNGFNIDSTHNFKDLRGGQSGTGDEQTLLVWTTNGMDLSTVVSNLQEFSSGLPYS